MVCKASLIDAKHHTMLQIIAAMNSSVRNLIKILLFLTTINNILACSTNQPRFV